MILPHLKHLSAFPYHHWYSNYYYWLHTQKFLICTHLPLTGRSLVNVSSWT